jgi:hypothetical protein
MASPLPRNIDASALRFAEPKTLDNGSKLVYVSHKGQRLFVQTPALHLPYGVNDSDEYAKKSGKPSTGPRRFDLNLAFRDLKTNTKVREMHDKMLEIEKAIVDAAFTNRLSWFRNDFKGMRDFVEEKFTPIIKVDKDPETLKPRNQYPPTMKVKLPYDAQSDTFNFQCYDMDKNEIDFLTVKDNLKGGSAQVLIQLTGLWFAGGNFGCLWKVHKAKFEKASGSSMDFVDDDDGEIEDEDLVQEARQAAPAAKKAVAAPAPKPKATVLPDTEEEEDVEAEAEEEVEEEDVEEEAEEEDAEEEAEEEEEREPTPPPREPSPPPAPVKKAPAKKAATTKKA